MFASSALRRILPVLGFLGVAHSATVNRTIDDSFGDSENGVKPLFTPSSAWNSGECSRCQIKPNSSLALRGTWTEGTYGPAGDPLSIRLTFEGTAIYVFFILADFNGNGLTTATNCAFSLDSTDRVPYHFASETTTSRNLLYNQLVFSRTGLANEEHVLDIIADGDQRSYLNFDYAIYTQEDEDELPIGRPTTGGQITAEPMTSTRLDSTTGILPSASSPPPPTSVTIKTTGEPAGGSSSASSPFSSHLIYTLPSGAPDNRDDDSDKDVDPKSSSTASSTTSSTSATAVTIIGVTLGSLAATAIAIVVWLWIWRRRKSRNPLHSVDTAPNNYTATDGQVRPFLYFPTTPSQPVTFEKLKGTSPWSDGSTEYWDSISKGDPRADNFTETTGKGRTSPF